MVHNPLLRPSMAAIAAALALSATPAFAQDALAAAQPPVVIAPTVEPVEPAPTDTVIEPSPVLSQASPEAAPAPPPVPTMQPIIHQPTAADLRATRTEPVTVAPRANPTQVARTANATPTAPTPVTIAPVKAVSTPAPVAAPVPARRTTIRSSAIDSEVLPYAGAGAAALLLIGGAAAMTRRRRREDAIPVERYEDERTLQLEPTDRVINPNAAPALARTAQPRVTRSTATALPNGFDLSRFGRHTQAAYRGPTSDNPSLSLRRRLKRASFFDGRERIAGENSAIEAAQVRAPIAAAARTAKVPAMADEQIVIRPRAVRKRPSLRPSFAR